MELPYCPQNRLVAKRFLSKLYQFTDQRIQVTIKWITEKIKSLFSLKEKNPYPACQIYNGTCVCDKTYIGETIRNVNIRWNEHEDICNESEHAKHLRENQNHTFNGKTLLQAPKSYQL